MLPVLFRSPVAVLIATTIRREGIVVEGPLRWWLLWTRQLVLPVWVALRWILNSSMIYWRKARYGVTMRIRSRYRGGLVKPKCWMITAGSSANITLFFVGLLFVVII
jgi:hypothetical protein